MAFMTQSFHVRMRKFAKELQHKGNTIIFHNLIGILERITLLFGSFIVEIVVQ